MKRIIFQSLLTVIFFSLSSCVKEQPSVPQSVTEREQNSELQPASDTDFLPDSLTASFADDSKAHVLPGSAVMVWNAKDELSVFGNSTNVKYIFNGHNGENFGTFSKAAGMKADVIGGGSEDMGRYKHLYALYPYSGSASCAEEGKIRTVLPMTQTYAAASFAPEANLMVAVTDDINDTKLKFRNVCGYLKFKLYSSTNAVVKKVTLCGNNGEKLSGDCTITASADGMPVVLMTGEDPLDSISVQGESTLERQGQFDGPSKPEQNEGFTEIHSEFDGMSPSCLPKSALGGIAGEDGKTYPSKSIIDCGEDGVELSASKESPTEFIFALPPTTFSKGFTISVTNEFDKVYEQSTTKNVVVGRSKMVPFSAIEIEQAECGTDFTEFVLLTQGGDKCIGTVSSDAVTVLVPSSVDRTSLKAEFRTTGKDVFVGAEKQTSGVTANDFTRPVTYRVTSAKGREKEYKVKLIDRPFMIACWGDSFTHYIKSESQSKPTHYPAILQELLGNTWEVYDGGYSGDFSNEIAARQGAIVTRVKKTNGFWFPTAKSAVTLESVYTDDKDLDPDPETSYETLFKFRPERWSSSIQAHAVNPCVINGVECTVYYPYVTRTSDGEPVFVEDGARVYTHGSRYARNADVIVMHLGTNGGWQHSIKNYDLLIKQHKAMIDYADNNGRYIVLASHISHSFNFHGGDDDTYLRKFHEAFTDAEGRDHVIELRRAVNSRAEEFLVSTGVCGSKSEISESDREYIAKGDWPLSFFYSKDDEHPSRPGSTAMAILIVEKMKELGYLEKSHQTNTNQNKTTNEKNHL